MFVAKGKDSVFYIRMIDYSEEYLRSHECSLEQFIIGPWKAHVSPAEELSEMQYSLQFLSVARVFLYVT